MSRERTVLLVDDVELFRELGSLFLSRTGRILTASSGEEGLEIARRERPDLILLDLVMPGLDGDAVCRFIKTDPDLHQIPVVLLVGADEASEWGRAVRAGADDVLSKPLSRVSLIETVRRFISGPKTVGQPRIVMDAQVELQIDGLSARGRLKNLSRGGLFVETGCEFSAETELELQFVLPDNSANFKPTARVIWKQLDPDKRQNYGIGLRFVDISSSLVRNLEDYIYDRALEPYPAPLGETT